MITKYRLYSQWTKLHSNLWNERWPHSSVNDMGAHLLSQYVQTYKKMQHSSPISSATERFSELETQARLLSPAPVLHYSSDRKQNKSDLTVYSITELLYQWSARYLKVVDKWVCKYQRERVRTVLVSMKLHLLVLIRYFCWSEVFWCPWKSSVNVSLHGNCCSKFRMYFK